MPVSDAELKQASGIIRTLSSRGVKLLALDFDKTFVDIHTRGIWTGSLDSLTEHTRPCFRAMAKVCLQQTVGSDESKSVSGGGRVEQMQLCVVTFSRQSDLIAQVLKNSLQNCDTSQVFVRGDSDTFPPAAFQAKKLGKELHLAWVVSKLHKNSGGRTSIDPKEIILFDDDPQNIQIAKQFGHQAMLVEDDVNLEKISQFVGSTASTKSKSNQNFKELLAAFAGQL